MKFISIALSLLFFPFLSYADNTKQETQNIKIKPYASLKLGYSDMGIKISKPTSKDFTNNTFSFNPAIGIEFNKKLLEVLSFRLEGEYFRNTSGDSKSWTVQRQWRTGTTPPYFTYHYETRKATINTTIDGLLLNAYTDLNVISSIRPYIVVGLGYGKITQENQLIVDTFNDYAMTGADTTEYVTYSEKHSSYNMFWQIGLGSSFDVTDKLSLIAEFRHINYGSLKLYALEYKYIANQFLIGAKYLF